MSKMDNSKASASAIKDSKNIWGSFVHITTICGGVIIAVLALMAMFLV